MANRDLTYLISFDAESGGLDGASEEIDRITKALDDIDSSAVDIDVDSRELEDATDEVEDLGDELRRMERQRVEIDVDGDEVERAASDVLALQAELDEFSAEQFRIDMELDLEESQARLRELADQLQELEEFDMPGVRAEVLSEFGEVQQRVEGLEQDLRDLDAAADSVGSGSGLTELGESAERASQGVGTLRDRSDQSRSVLANMAGNAAQDLGELGGAAGTAGIAISQMVEYAVDGNIALRNFASIVGPMAAIGGATLAITSGFRAVSEVLGRSAENVEALNEQMDGLDVTASDLLQMFSENKDALILPEEITVSWGDYVNVLQEMLHVGDGFEEFDVAEILNDAGISLSTFAHLIEDAADSTATWDEQTQAMATFMGELQRALDAGAISAEEYDAALRSFVENEDNVRNAQQAATREAELFAASIDEINAAMDTHTGAAEDMAGLWETLVNDLADGSLETAAAREAWNTLRVELGLTEEAMAELAQQKVDEKLQEDADAAEEVADAARDAAEATEDWIRANREFDPNDLRWALVADGANKLREGVELTATQVEALQGLVEQYGLSETDVLDEGLRMWEDHQQAAEEALQAEADAVEDAIEGLQEHAGAVIEAAQAFVEMQSAVDDVARSLDDVADRGGAMSGVLAELGRIGELGQSQELIGFVGGLQGVVDAIDELSRSDLEGLDLVPDTWDEVLNMPEELGPVVQALGTFAGDVQREMSQAFEAGGDAGVREWAENTRTAITEALLGAADLTEGQVNEILSALGLLPEQIEMAIVISNQERATSVIESMASVIAGLPAETQLRIAAVADTDPIAALQLTIDALAAQGYEIPVELVALVDELDGEVEAHVPPPVTVGVEGDMLPVTKAVEDFTAEEKSVVVKAEADTEDAEVDLGKTAEPRTAQFEIDLWNIIVQNALLNKVAEPRTAKITAEAHTFAAENALDAAAADRTAAIDGFLRSFPTERDIVNRLTGGKGHIVIPVDTRIRYVARIDGSRVPG